MAIKYQTPYPCHNPSEMTKTVHVLSNMEKSTGTASRVTSGGAVLSSDGSGLSINSGMGSHSGSE